MALLQESQLESFTVEPDEPESGPREVIFTEDGPLGMTLNRAVKGNHHAHIAELKLDENGEDGMAGKLGICIGDTVLAVNGEPVVGFSAPDIVEKMTSSGRPLTLTLEHQVFQALFSPIYPTSYIHSTVTGDFD